MAEELTVDEKIEIDNTQEKDLEIKEEIVEEKEVEKPKEEEKELEIETRPAKEEKIDYGEDVNEDDIKTIGGIVEKQTAGFKKTLQETQDRLEVESFIREKPEFAKYEAKILKYVQHPAYSQIPVKNIASMVASNDLVKMGATAEREAQAKADATKSGGSTARNPGGSSTDWSKASKEDFELQKRRVMGQDI